MAKNKGNKKKDTPVLVVQDLQINSWNQSINAEPTYSVFGSPADMEWLPRRVEPLTVQISGTVSGMNVQLNMAGGIAIGDLREILSDAEGAVRHPLKLTISKKR